MHKYGIIVILILKVAALSAENLHLWSQSAILVDFETEQINFLRGLPSYKDL